MSLNIINKKYYIFHCDINVYVFFHRVITAATDGNWCFSRLCNFTLKFIVITLLHIPAMS